MADMTAGGLFDGAEDGFVLVPEDTYDVVVKKTEYKSSKTNKPQVVVTLAIVGGPYNGKTVRTWMTFTPKDDPSGNGPVALAILQKELTALLGEDIVTKLTAMPTAALMMEKAAELLQGKPARAKVAVEPYNEEDRNSVKALMAPSAQAVGAAAAADPFATAAPVAAPAAAPVATAEESEADKLRAQLAALEAQVQAPSAPEPQQAMGQALPF